MPDNIDQKLRKYFPPDIVDLLINAGNKSSAVQKELFLVGGSVRDLFLNRVNLDLDLVVEGDAIELARELAKEYRTNIIIHRRFGTAKLNFDNFSLDMATARSETYEKPGALPTVQSGTITEDLQRRDFSINAMAIYLTPHNFGKLIDPHNGIADISSRFIRILHPRSFADDATRILRAIRYEKRLLFTLEPETLKLLKNSTQMLNTISSTRLKHELDLILKEEYPEQILKRAEELGIINKLHPSLRGNGWLSDKFDQARQLCIRSSPLHIYYCLLVYHLSEKDCDQFISRLNIPKKLAQMMTQTLILKSRVHKLERIKVKPSEIFDFLNGYTVPVIQANMLSAESVIIRQYLQLYLSKLRNIKPQLTGDDLVNLGISSGPELGQILNEIRKQKLDGKIKTRTDEEILARNRHYSLGKPGREN